MILKLSQCIRINFDVHLFRKVSYCRYFSSTNLLKFSTNSTQTEGDISSNNDVPLSSGKTTEEFITIYTNPGIKYFSIINKAVRFPTVIAAGIYPITLVLFSADFITTRTVISVLFLVSWCCLVLHVLAMNIWRKVGFLYVNKDVTKLKVGYVTYWGKRDDVILPLKDVMSFSDLPKTPFDFVYRKVKTFDARRFNFYKLDMRGGNVVNRDLFEKIFGSTES